MKINDVKVRRFQTTSIRKDSLKFFFSPQILFFLYPQKKERWKIWKRITYYIRQTSTSHDIWLSLYYFSSGYVRTTEGFQWFPCDWRKRTNSTKAKGKYLFQKCFPDEIYPKYVPIVFHTVDITRWWQKTTHTHKRLVTSFWFDLTQSYKYCFKMPFYMHNKILITSWTMWQILEYSSNTILICASKAMKIH